MSKALIVAGMHRSMTSGVARALHRDGIADMGQRMKRDGNGGKGFWEDYDFYEVNCDILAAAGGDWKNPPPRSRIMAVGARAEFQRRMRDLTARREASERPWGWKDPRNCLTLGLWLEHMPPDAHIVGVFRKPSAVAASLHRREGGDLARWHNLATDYNERLLFEIGEFLT